MVRIGIYPRKSVYRDNSESVSVQVKMCKDYANIIYSGQDPTFHIYDKDEGFTGKNTNRPSYQDLMSDVRNGLLDVVMVYKLDRISRNVQEFSSMFEVFRANNVSFISVKESFDTNSPIGRTVMYILAAFSQLEREQISIRVADNMQALGAAGKWTGGKCPAGMKSIRRKVDGKTHSYLIIDEENIWRTKLMYDLILGGYTITGIERYFRDNDITTQTGKFMRSSQIYFILTNPVYCQNDMNAYYYFKELGCSLPDPKLFDGEKGLVAYGRTKNADNIYPSQRVVSKDGWTISIGIHDWIIPSESWIAAQNRLGINKQERSNKHKVGILKGILRCKCGAKMANNVCYKNNILFAYYYCQDAARQGTRKCIIRYHKISHIDDLFISKLKEIRLNPDCIKIQEADPLVHLNIPTIRENIKQTEQAINNLTVQLQENKESSAAKYIITQIEVLDKKLASLSNQLRQAEIHKIQAKSNMEQQQHIYNNICFLLDNFDNLDYSAKNDVVKKITQRCILDGDILDITF